jgi:hypothetical protein
MAVTGLVFVKGRSCFLPICITLTDEGWIPFCTGYKLAFMSSPHAKVAKGCIMLSIIVEPWILFTPL